jgi:hypothetical protein
MASSIEQDCINLYTLQLNGGKYFVHVQPGHGDQSDQEIIDTCTQLYDFVRGNLPAHIVDTVNYIDPIQIDRYVIQLMSVHGVDNVRGGSYEEPTLPDYMEKSALAQLDTVINLVHNVNLRMDRQNADAPIRPRLTVTAEHYAAFKFFVHKNKSYTFNREYLRHEIAWLFDHIDAVCYNTKYNIRTHISSETGGIIQQKYRQLTIYLRELPRFYLNTISETGEALNPSVESRELRVYLYNPELILDAFVYNTTVDQSTIEKARPIIDQYQELIWDIYCTVCNYISEIEFIYYNQ